MWARRYDEAGDVGRAALWHKLADLWATFAAHLPERSTQDDSREEGNS